MKMTRSRRFLVLLVVALLWGVGTKARAQPVKPNILFIFDTSGSMLSSSCDGQDPPVGDGNDGTGSYIYTLKQAVYQALFFVGVDEANFGLMRFPQMENACNLDSCNFSSLTAGYYRVDSSQYGGANNNNGCKLSLHSDETSYGAWFMNSASEAVVVPVTDPSAGLEPPDSSFFDPDDANIPLLLEWMNHVTTCSANTITDPEIQAIPSQFTPLGRSLFYARLYFDNFVIPNEDQNVLPCRNNVVVLITDGAETCDNDLTSMSSEPSSLSDCDAVGGDDEFNPTRQACLLFMANPPNHPYSIKTYVLTRTGLGGSNDAIALAGGTTEAIEADFNNQDDVKQALLGIIAEAVPSGETCNNIDDDCDGVTDEGVRNSCSSYPQWCEVEACNNIDDDCDGVTDEGLPTNPCGDPCGAPVPQEVCNGIDDDCDGLLDTDDPDYYSGPDASCPCTVEECDGLDNDCDGFIDTDDTDYGPPAGGCGGVPNTGECVTGSWVCGPNPGNGGVIEEYCEGAVGPTDEECDGLDNDCNSVIDDVTYDPSACVVPDCDTGCCDGHWECVNGEDVCVPDAVGTDEECDGLDNDCDGRIDEGAICATPLVCFYGECVSRVPPDGCGADYHEIQGLCVSDICEAVHCDDGTACDPEEGTIENDYCVDPCDGVSCDPGLACDVVCDGGGCQEQCVAPDCYLDPSLCADGEICLEGSCVPDSCFGSGALDCGDEACRQGGCVPTCAGVDCDEGFVCRDGQCMEQPCDSQLCPPGRTCVDGQCAQDPCGGVSCGVGRVCRAGVCVDDPCRLIVCPAGTACNEEGQCLEEQTNPNGDGGPGDDSGVDGGGVPVVDASGRDVSVVDGTQGLPDDMSVSAAGGGGCACSVDSQGRGGAALFLLFFGVVALLARRRKQR